MSKFWFDEELDLDERYALFGENLGGHLASVEIVDWRQAQRPDTGQYWPPPQTPPAVPHYMLREYDPFYGKEQGLDIIPKDQPFNEDDVIRMDEEGNRIVRLWPHEEQGPWYYPVWSTPHVAGTIANYLATSAVQAMHMEPRVRPGQSMPTDMDWYTFSIMKDRFTQKLVAQLVRPIQAKLLRLVDEVSPNDNYWQETIWHRRGLHDQVIQDLLTDDHLRSDYEKYSACRSVLETAWEHGHAARWREAYPHTRFFNRLITIVGTRLMWYWRPIRDSQWEGVSLNHISLEDTGIWRLKMLMAALGHFGPDGKVTAWANNSSNAECWHAWRKWARYAHLRGNPGYKTIKDLFQDLGDVWVMLEQYPDIGKMPSREATLSAAIEESIKIHNAYIKRSAQEHSNQVLAVPPWGEDMPAGWRRFKIGQELIQEGQDMRHCVGSYVDLAVAGQTFLYHSSVQGDPCTIEVTPKGEIRQARGIKDGQNRATKAARSQWSRFIKNLYPCPWCGAPADIDRLIEHGRCVRCEQLWGDRQPDLTLLQLPERVPYRDENAGSFGINPAGEAEDYIPF